MALLKVHSITGQESFEVILKHLKSLVFFNPTTLKIKQITLEFKTLHYIPYIIVQNTIHLEFWASYHYYDPPHYNFN